MDIEKNKDKIVSSWSKIKYFSYSEFDSPDSKDSGLFMSIPFIEILDALREKCGFPFVVNSGYRTKEHNAKVGGVDASAHEEGVACDIAVSSGRERFLLVSNAITLGIKRVGVAKTFIHLDMSFSLPSQVIWTY